jgi:hypothetical protein
LLLRARSCADAVARVRRYRACAFFRKPPLITEKIQVRVTETRQLMEVVVFSKRASAIEVVIGEGVHSVKCALSPTRNGQAYAGSVMGREIVYERSREQVQADIDRLNPRAFNRR